MSSRSRSRSKIHTIGHPYDSKIPEQYYDTNYRNYTKIYKLKTPYSGNVISGPYNTRIPLGFKKKYSEDFMVAGPHNKTY